MQMMTRKKLMPTTLMVLLSLVALGGLLLVNPSNTPLSPGGEAWATSLGARGGVGTSAGAGGGARRARVRVLPPGALPGLLELGPCWRWRWCRGRGCGCSRQGRRRGSSGDPKRLCTVRHRRPLTPNCTRKEGHHDESRTRSAAAPSRADHRAGPGARRARADGLGMRDADRREASRHPDRLSPAHRERALGGTAVRALENGAQAARAPGSVRRGAGGGARRAA